MSHQERREMIKGIIDELETEFGTERLIVA